MCSDNTLTPPSDSQESTLQKSTVEQDSAASDSKLITSDPTVFADKLKSLQNQNEVLIVLKKASAPRIAKNTLKDLPTGTDDVIALPETALNAPRRSSPGFATVQAQGRQSFYNRYVSVGSTDFYLRINVTSGPEQAEHTIFVDVATGPGDDCPPGYICPD